MLNDTFGHRLKEALAMSRMTQSELARKTNIDKSLITNYLKGRYKAKQENIYNLAKALNVSPAWLIGFDILEEENNFTDDEIIILYNKTKHILNDTEKDLIVGVMKNALNKKEGKK